MTREAKHPVSTSKKTIRIVEALRDLDGARITELADELDMNKSTIHNHLSTLEEEELVVKDGPEYNIGLRFLEFGGYVRSKSRIYRVAEPELKRLAEQTGEIASLMVEEYGRGVYLATAKGTDAANVNIYSGLRQPLHATALGKSILAHLPEDRLEEILDRHGLEPQTSTTITDRATLYDQLEKIREQGYAVDDGELIEGLQCIGTPIVTSQGTVRGAISVSAPTNRMSDDRFLDEIPDAVRSASNVIELNLTYS